jgi:LCP family protein required for cell wall assembly
VVRSMVDNNTNTELNSNTSMPNRSRKLQESKRMHPLLKSFLIIGLIIILAGVGYAGYVYVKFDNMLGKISSALTGDDDTSSKEPKVILLLGLDTREATRSLNTDVIMVAVLNPKTQAVSLLSLPRDLYMKPDGYRARKANAFYSIAQRQDKEPPDQLVKELFGEILDIPIDYVTVITFKTFEDIIDELGGIEVDVDMNMCYIDTADGTNIQLMKGNQELDGKNALDFVRYRHSTRKCKVPTAESSDSERNERQQIVLKAMVDKMTSVGGMLKLGNVFDAMGNNLKTDTPKDQLKSLILSYATMNKDNITFIPLPGEWISPYVRVKDTDMDKAKQLLKAALTGDTVADSGTP